MELHQTCLECSALYDFAVYRDCGNVESERSVTGHVSKPVALSLFPLSNSHLYSCSLSHLLSEELDACGQVLKCLPIILND